MRQTQSLIVGICGGSASGKSLMAEALAELLEGDAVIFSQDAYYHDSSELPASKRALKNYDHPDAIDLPSFATDLQKLASGQAIQLPQYCFTSHRSQRGKCSMQPAAVIIVEGLFMFQNQTLRQLYDLKVFMHASSEERLRRRIMRDSNHRGRTPEAVTRQYFATVKPMHERYVEPNRRFAQFIFNPSDRDQLQNCAARLMTHIQVLRERISPS